MITESREHLQSKPQNSESIIRLDTTDDRPSLECESLPPGGHSSKVSGGPASIEGTDVKDVSEFENCATEEQTPHDEVPISASKITAVVAGLLLAVFCMSLVSACVGVLYPP
jgi:hypothetical protein